jgi:hypothetical protein
VGVVSEKDEERVTGAERSGQAEKGERRVDTEEEGKEDGEKLSGEEGGGSGKVVEELLVENGMEKRGDR